jgi:hypothetical protein
MPAVPTPAAHRTRSSSPRAGGREHELRVTKTLWPGQAGTVRLHQRCGDALVCVRYRRDATGLRRTTTVELVVAEALVCGRSAQRALFDVKIGIGERSLQAQAKARGGRWNPHKELWTMTGIAVQQLGLIERVRMPPVK